MGRRLEYEVKTSVRLNMSNPQHVKINDVIQNLDPKIFKSKNQFIIDAIQFYIDNYGKETFVIKKKEKERAEYIRSEDIDDIKEEVIEAATNEARKEVIRLLGGVISGMNVGQPVIMQAANSEAQEPTEDLGDEGSFDFDIKKAKKVGADFRNDLCNGMVKYFPDHFEDESKFCKALFIKKYPSSLSDRFINEITSLPVHSITSIDVVPVPKDLTTKVLQKKYLGIESDIIKQQRVRNKNNDFSTEISYAKRTEKKEIEEIMDDVRENDQCLFFVDIVVIGRLNKF